MAKLTDRACATTKPKPTGNILLGDGYGLWLVIHSGGTRTWMIDYLVKGKRQKINLGNYDSKGGDSQDLKGLLDGGILSLAQARLVAAEWKQLRRAGRDPAAEREELKAAERARFDAELAQPTVAEAAKRFFEKNVEGKRSAKQVKYRLDRLAASSIGNKKIRDVTRQNVIAVFEKIAEGQKEGKTAKLLAGEVLTTAKRLWRYAEAHEWVAQSCIAILQRKDFDAAYKPRQVRLRLDEVAELWRALNDPLRCKSDPVTIAAIKLVILTGQRESEVAEAEWNEFDLDTGIWYIPAHRTKMERSHRVHLSPQTIAVLDAVKLITGQSRFVFASPLKENQPIWGRSLNNALGTMFRHGHLPKVTPCHIHDLRRSLISGLPDLGFAAHIGHKIANHRLQGVFAIYNHAEYMDERRAALYLWAERIETLANCNNLFQFSQRAA
jgi:integrase